MIGMFITFLVLFGLIKIFERDRDDLDNFTIATVAIVPVLAAIIVKVVLSFLFPNPLLLLVAPAVTLIGLTFGLLWKHLEIKLSHSIVYTIVVAVVNELQAFALASM